MPNNGLAPPLELVSPLWEINKKSSPSVFHLTDTQTDEKALFGRKGAVWMQMLIYVIIIYNLI